MASENKKNKICKLSDRLKELGNTNKTAELLYSAWNTDSQNVGHVINVVSAPYTVFSDHGSSHSEGIISAIELLLGEDRINALGYTDIWLILECAYRHDIGMHTSNKEILDIIDTKSFEEFMDQLKSHPNEETRRAVENLNNYKTNGSYNESRREALREINNLQADFNSVLLEYLRPKHGIRSEEKIKNEDHKLYFIPDRMWTIIGSICKGHYENLEDCLGRLTQHEKGIDNDIAHPKFVQMLLRIGDLLDIDNNRFNTSQLELLNEEKISLITKGEILKHKAVSNLYISPKKISLYFSIMLEESCDDLKRDQTVKAACNSISNLRKYIRTDLKEFAEKWSQIAPDTMSGSVPVDCDFKLTLNGTLTDPDELSLKYTFNHKRASKIIQGTNLYRTPLDIIDSVNTYRPINITNYNKHLGVNWVFLREFIQNALDATKIQFFDELKLYEEDLYNSRSQFDKNLLTPDFILHGFDNQSGCDLVEERIDYQRYKEKYQYRINNAAVELSIDCAYPEDKRSHKKCCEDQDEKGNNGYNFIIKVRDRGIGIDKNTLKSMKNIGNESVVFINREIPSWLEPTASFGIGMQSAFELVNEFSATSFARSDNKMRRIIFRSAKNGGEVFSYETGNNKHGWYGTEFTFIIPASKIAEQYGVRFISKERVFYDIKKYIHKSIKHDIFPLEVTYKDSISLSDACPHKKHTYKFKIHSIFDMLPWNKAKETQEYGDNGYYFPSYEPKDGSFTVLKLSNNRSVKLTEQRDGIKINYRGIDVGSRLKTLLYSDIEAYVWGGKASEILMINREEFLTGGTGFILEKVHKAFLDLAVYVTTKRAETSAYPNYINKELERIIKHLTFAKENPSPDSIMSTETSSLSVSVINLIKDDNVFRPTEIMKRSMDNIFFNWQNIWFTNYPLEAITNINTIEILGMDEDIFLAENIFHDMAKGYNDKIKTNEMFIGNRRECYFTAYKYGFNETCTIKINEANKKEWYFYKKYLKDEIENYFEGRENSSNYWGKQSPSQRSYVYYAIPPLESWRKEFEDLLLEMSEERLFNTPSGSDFVMHYLVAVVESDYKDEYKNQIEKCKEICRDDPIVKDKVKFDEIVINAFVERIIDTDYCKELLTFISHQNKREYRIIKKLYKKYLIRFYGMLLIDE
jgi:hypothetical protein